MGSESMDSLNSNYKELRSFRESLDNEVRHADAKAIQLAGAYVIFEGIMSTQAISPAVGKRWLPVCLSAWVSIAFWLTFVTTVNNCLRLRRQQDSTLMEQDKLHRKIFSTQTGQKQVDGGAAAQQSLANYLASLRFRRFAYVGVVHSALLSFALLVSYALLPKFR